MKFEINATNIDEFLTLRSLHKKNTKDFLYEETLGALSLDKKDQYKQCIKLLQLLPYLGIFNETDEENNLDRLQTSIKIFKEFRNRFDHNLLSETIFGKLEVTEEKGSLYLGKGYPEFIENALEALRQKAIDILLSSCEFNANNSLLIWVYRYASSVNCIHPSKYSDFIKAIQNTSSQEMLTCINWKIFVENAYHPKFLDNLNIVSQGKISKEILQKKINQFQKPKAMFNLSRTLTKKIFEYFTERLDPNFLKSVPFEFQNSSQLLSLYEVFIHPRDGICQIVAHHLCDL